MERSLDRISNTEVPLYIDGQLWAVDDMSPFGVVINALLREEGRTERFRVNAGSSGENPEAPALLTFAIFDSNNPESVYECAPFVPVSRNKKGLRFGFTTSRDMFEVLVESELLVESYDPSLYELVLRFPVAAYLLDIKVRAGIAGVSLKKEDKKEAKVVLDFYMKQTRGSKLFSAFSPFTKRLFDSAIESDL